MNIQGKVFEIGEEENPTPTFRKRDLVIEYAENPMYPQFILIVFKQDKVALLDKLQAGQNVEIAFNLRGRAWTPKEGGKTKYFNELEGWKVTAGEGVAVAVAGPQADYEQGEDEDDLPF